MGAIEKSETYRVHPHPWGSTRAGRACEDHESDAGIPRRRKETRKREKEREKKRKKI